MNSIPKMDECDVLVDVRSRWAITHHRTVANLTLDGDQNISLTESCPRQLGLMMEQQDSLVSSEVESEVRNVLSGQEDHLTNSKIMVKRRMPVREIRDEPTNRDEPLDLNFLRPEKRVFHALVFGFVEFTVPSAGLGRFSKTSFIANARREVDSLNPKPFLQYPLAR